MKAVLKGSRREATNWYELHPTDVSACTANVVDTRVIATAKMHGVSMNHLAEQFNSQHIANE